MIEDIHERYELLTREGKIWAQKKRGKSVVGNWENDRVLLAFSSAYGMPSGETQSMRQMQMPCEVTEVGLENITLKPFHYEDARSRDLDFREFVRQENGFQVDLLNFSVGGAQVRGGDAPEQNEAFLKYLVGDDYDEMDLAQRVDALQRHAVVLHFYPVMNFVRSDITEYEPYLPCRMPVIARVARFRTSRSKEEDDLSITSLGVEFIYNPLPDSYSRDANEFDQWEQITPYTENTQFIEIHKSLQLLFGFDRAKEESFREVEKKPAKEDKEETEAEADAEDVDEEG